MNRDGTPGIRLARPRRVSELQALHGGVLDAGIGDRLVERIVAPEHAGDGSGGDELVIVTSSRRVTDASSAAGVLLCQRELSHRCRVGQRWVHDHAAWVLARLLAEETPPPARTRRCAGHVDAGASVDETADVRAFAVVLAGAHIGPGSVIGEGAVVYGGVRLGARVLVGPNAVLGRPGFGWVEGPRGETLRMPQLGGVIVEDDVEIGALATVDAGTLSPTRIRQGAKVDAHVHVGHNVEIGAGTLVAAQAGFAGSVRLGAAVRVGGQAGVTDHAVIGAGARIAAKSGVIGDVAPGAVVAGYPAVPRIAWLRAWARLLGRGRRPSR